MRAIESQRCALVVVGKGKVPLTDDRLRTVLPMSKRLSKTDVNFWLDVMLLCVFLLLCWCSVIVRYVFPVATKTEGWLLWGMDYLAWGDLQFVVLCTLAAGILLHVMLHWSWVCGVVASWRRKRSRAPVAKQDNGSRTLWGVALLIAICNVLGLGIAAAVLTIEGPAL